MPPKTDNLGREVGAELYHLPTDPNENKNLIDERTKTAYELHLKMVRFLKQLRVNEAVLELWKRL